MVMVVLLLLLQIAIVETLLPTQGAGVSKGLAAVASSVMTTGKEEFMVRRSVCIPLPLDHFFFCFPAG